MSILAVIPARWASTRLPQKVLRMIGDKTMIQRVYEKVRACSGIDDVVIAVDNALVAECVESFGAKFMFTSIDHQSGTDRCAEVIRSQKDCSYVINVQGDEPFINPKTIEILIDLLKSRKARIVSLMNPIQNADEIHNPNIVKVVVNNSNEALYFSRAAIPYQRGVELKEFSINSSTYKHQGIYGFEVDALLEVSKLAPGKLELLEKLEQLRWLENGYKIQMGISEFPTMGIDTEEDLEKARRIVGA
ncbi:MAG: 3-deoxy-manno-octulosonate cytidylyltransferase [Saprospiraceae bacterium]|nr:3-deoxy-manno-octulosonate cytidylyltransferase [Saprospiraceae bacterium]